MPWQNVKEISWFRILASAKKERVRKQLEVFNYKSNLPEISDFLEIHWFSRFSYQYYMVQSLNNLNNKNENILIQM